MKFTTFYRNNEPSLGLVEGNGVIDLSGQVASLRAALECGGDLLAVVDAAKAAGVQAIPLSDVQLAPVIPEPGKLVCLGLNYFDHAKEGGREKPDYPWFFLRGKSSLIAATEAGRVPVISERFDYEAELAVVIGTTVPRHTSKDDALQYVFGYSCFNDMSVRDYQKRTPQWTIGKNFDATGAFGPVVVTADELPAGAMNLTIQSRLNGEIMQDASTSDMIWTVAETIELLAQCMTLEPGDVIAMGTPAGVGQARTPQVWMKSGDVVEIEIEGIGTLCNPILNEGE